MRAAVVGRLKEAAVLLAIAGQSATADQFNAAAAFLLAHLPKKKDAAWLESRVTESPPGSVGHQAWLLAKEALDGKTGVIISTLRKELPQPVVQLLRIRGMGPRQIHTAWKQLGVTSLERLVDRLHDGSLVTNGVLDPLTAENMKRTAVEFQSCTRFILRPDLEAAVASIASRLLVVKGAEMVEVVGEPARGVPGVPPIKLLVGTHHRTLATNQLLEFMGGETPETNHPGAPTTLNLLVRGIPMEVSFCEPGQFAIRSYRESSTPDHWLALLDALNNVGYSVRDDRLCNDKGDAKPLELSRPQDIFAVAGLQFIDSERRGDPLMVPRATQGVLPPLIRLEDIQGDLHTHTDCSDGDASPAQMIAAASTLGYSYLAITDHSHSTWTAGGLAPENVSEYVSAIRRLSLGQSALQVLVGVEVDILSDGSLDLPDSALSQFDIVIASIHSDFHLPTETLLRRLDLALSNPLVNALAHPTGRLLHRRSGLPIPQRALVEIARRHGVWIELNSNPERLDLDASGVATCASLGVPVMISSDAHNTDDLRQIRWGVQEARVAGLEPHQVVNTWPLHKLRKALVSRRHPLSGHHQND